MRLALLALTLLTSAACGGRTAEENALIKARFEELTRRIERVEAEVGLEPPVAAGADRKSRKSRGPKADGAAPAPTSPEGDVDADADAAADAKATDGKAARGKRSRGGKVVVERSLQVVDAGAPAEVAVAEGAPTMKLVRKKGDDPISLPGRIAPGSYTILARFEEGSPPAQAGQLVVEGSTTLTLSCDRDARTCGAE